MMQVDEITLYRHDGRQRSIFFVPGSLNIITGQSAKGKSSLINIIRFLLASTSPHFPSGPIQENVAWVGGRFRLGDTKVFVGRPAPAQGSETTAAMLLVGATEVPEFGSLESNTTIADVRAYLGLLIGIEENLHLPPSGNSRAPLAANLSHALYYCFQSQGEIANPDLLFHHQNREFQSQAIRDTLPFFLGAQGADELRRRERLSDLRRQQRQYALRLRIIVEEAESGLGPTASLVAEARRAGLLNEGDAPTSLGEARQLLAQALEASMPAAAAPESARREFNELLGVRQRLVMELRYADDGLASLEDFSQVDDGYLSELHEQRARLSSIGLLRTSMAEAVCPLCSQALTGDESPERRAVEAALGQVAGQLVSAGRARPHIEAARQKLLSQKSETSRRLGEVNETLNGLTRQAEEEERLSATLDLASWVKGRISQYLDLFPASPDQEKQRLERRLQEITSEIAQLETDLDSETLRSRTTSLMMTVSRRMTQHAQTLGLEHSEHGARIDHHRLTVVADTPHGPAYMDRNEIGSGMNWVGYHVAAYLALQEFFVDRGRPVPSFIVFDQPSQAFFPQDRIAGGDLEELSDTDRANTLSLYSLMADVIGELDGRLQVIALDHADFDEPWFQASVIERWRGDAALIPVDWLD